MIAIVDYGMGNLRSVYNALDRIGGEPLIVSDPEQLAKADRIILPGVGSFGGCIDNLTRTGFQESLKREVLERGKPILGICLGMQVMAAEGDEFGLHPGLGWFDARVELITPEDASLRVPHIGWNDITCSPHPLFAGLPALPDVYFVHSFHMRCNTSEHVVATCDYGGLLTAAVARDNIFATQFHPEKSQDLGLRILENFLDWKP